MRRIQNITHTALRFLASGVLALGFLVSLRHLSPLVHPVIPGALILPGTLIAGVLMLTMPLDSLFNLVLAEDVDGRDRFILAGYVCIFLFWWAAIFLAWGLILRRRQAHQADFGHSRPAVLDDTEGRDDQPEAGGVDCSPKRWRYLLQAALAALLFGVWAWHDVPQLYRAYSTGLIRTGGGGRSGSYVYLQHQPDEFILVVVVTILFGLALVGGLLWNVRRYRGQTVEPALPRSSSIYLTRPQRR